MEDQTKMTPKEYNGLSERHVAQIIRRSMIQKVVPSKKGGKYKRKKFKGDETEPII